MSSERNYTSPVLAACLHERAIDRARTIVIDISVIPLNWNDLTRFVPAASSMRSKGS